ncbi:MAG TPA: DUF4013 domain-containing protein [Thermoanaerobaculia bacterium]|nr:DUF4013 domain-containing protein [Thermoanaerobaculia bacterium]
MIQEHRLLDGGKIDYQRALRYQLDDPSWVATLFFVTLAVIVPLIGPIIAMGYQGTVVEALARGGINAPPPRFDFGNLGDYLVRGLRMFLVSLLVSLILLPVIWLGCALVLVTVLPTMHVLGPGEGLSTLVGCSMLAVFGLLALALGLAVSVLMTPPIVRAALDHDLGGIFDFAYARDFLKRTGADGWKAHLYFIAINLGLFVVGLLACVIGIFPAAAFGMLVQSHLYGQLYLLYLHRGGRRVESAIGG